MNYYFAYGAILFSMSDNTGKHNSCFIINAAVCSLKVHSHTSQNHFFWE